MKPLLISAIAGSAILSAAAVSFYIQDKSRPATGNVQTTQVRETTTPTPTAKLETGTPARPASPKGLRIRTQ
jgi:hypothetical protein